MSATVLNSPHAVEMSVYVVRAFVKLRELLSSNRVLSRKLDELELRLTNRLDAHDEAIAAILSAIRELTNPPPVTRAMMGFTATLEERSWTPKVDTTQNVLKYEEPRRATARLLNRVEKDETPAGLPSLRTEIGTQPRSSPRSSGTSSRGAAVVG